MAGVMSAKKMFFAAFAIESTEMTIFDCSFAQETGYSAYIEDSL